MLGSNCKTTPITNTSATTKSSLVLQSKVIERFDDSWNESNQQADLNSVSSSFPPLPKYGFPAPQLRSSKVSSCLDKTSTTKAPLLSKTFSPSFFSIEEEKDLIDNENQTKLASMTEQEITEAQLFIKERLSTASLDFLKNRRKPNTSINQEAKSSLNYSSLCPSSSLNETFPPNSTNSSSSSSSLASSIVDAFSPSQLALQLPYPISSYYFSFRGDCVTQDSDPCCRTFPAILTLTHSRSIPQRVMAATWLGHLLNQLQKETYSPLVKQHLIQAFYDLHAFLHLRQLLDDTCPSVVLATLQAWTCWMPSQVFQLEAPLHLVHVLWVPFWSKLNLNTEESASLTLTDQGQWIRLNWVRGLLPTHLFTRLTYLFTTMFSTKATLASNETIREAPLELNSHHLGRYCILKWMYFICFFSNQACRECIDITLKEVIPYFHRSWTSFTSAPSTSSSSFPLATSCLENEEQELVLWLLLLRCLVQSDPNVATTWLVPWMTTMDIPFTLLSSRASSTFFKALASLFTILISYGFHPPMAWSSFLLQLDTSLLPLPFTLQLISCMQQHQLALPSLDFSLILSSTHTLLLQPPSFTSMTPHALPLDTWVTLSEAWTFVDVVSNLDLTCYASWLTFLCNFLKEYFSSLPLSATTTTATTHAPLLSDQSQDFPSSDDSTLNVASSSVVSHSKASLLDASHPSKPFVWNFATPISLNDGSSVLSKALLCLHFLFLHLPSTEKNIHLFKDWMEWVNWLFQTAPTLDWIIPLARVFSTFLLHPNTPEFIKSFPHLHSEFSLMAYYALIYLPVPFEPTWDRLYQHACFHLDSSLWSTFFVPSMDATLLKETTTKDLSCLYMETPSLFVLGPQAYRRFKLSEQLVWFDQVYTWHQTVSSKQACLGLTFSDLIPFYLDSFIVSHLNSSSMLLKLTHATLDSHLFEDTAFHRMEWDTLIHHLLSQSYLNSILQQGLIYLLFHSNVAVSFKLYALTFFLTTVSPMLIQRCLVCVPKVPLSYFEPTLCKPWINLCAQLLSMLNTSQPSLLLWCTLVQLPTEHPIVTKLPLHLQFKLKEFIRCIQEYQKKKIQNEIELPSF